LKRISLRERQLWKNILGTPIESFTRKGVTYTVYGGEDGKLACDCPDHEFNNGSWQITFHDENGKEQTMIGCKHLATYLHENDKTVRATQIRTGEELVFPEEE
jgi:hypothetical protein